MNPCKKNLYLSTTLVAQQGLSIRVSQRCRVTYRSSYVRTLSTWWPRCGSSRAFSVCHGMDKGSEPKGTALRIEQHPVAMSTLDFGKPWASRGVTTSWDIYFHFSGDPRSSINLYWSGVDIWWNLRENSIRVKNQDPIEHERIPVIFDDQRGHLLPGLAKQKTFDVNGKVSVFSWLLRFFWRVQKLALRNIYHLTAHGSTERTT